MEQSRIPWGKALATACAHPIGEWDAKTVPPILNALSHLRPDVMVTTLMLDASFRDGSPIWELRSALLDLVADHAAVHSSDKQTVDLTVVLRALDCLLRLDHVGLYLALHFIRSLRVMAGCPPLLHSFFFGMSARNTQAIQQLHAEGITRPQEVFDLIKDLPCPRNCAASSCVCFPSLGSLELELPICSAFKAYKKYHFVDFGQAAALGIDGNSVLALHAEHHAPSCEPILGPGEPGILDAIDLLDIAGACLPSIADTTTAVPFRSFFRSLFQYGWMTKAHLLSCPDVLALRYLWQRLRFNKTDLRDRVLMALAGHQVW
jgi:hypothetical protein